MYLIILWCSCNGSSCFSVRPKVNRPLGKPSFKHSEFLKIRNNLSLKMLGKKVSIFIASGADFSNLRLLKYKYSATTKCCSMKRNLVKEHVTEVLLPTSSLWNLSKIKFWMWLSLQWFQFGAVCARWVIMLARGSTSSAGCTVMCWQWQQW